MTTYFVDTSALVKRYIIEIGSKWVLSWIEPQANNVIAVSEIAYVEIRSAFARRVRDGSLSSGNAQRLKSDAEAHLRMEYLITPVDTGLLQIAGQMVDSYTLRTLDSIQLACAMRAQNILQVPLIFISADTNLLAAATAEGFTVDNPLSYP